MADPLAIEKAFLLDNLDELSADHPGKYLLIKGKAVHGAFETFEQGVVAGTTKFGAGPFLVRSYTPQTRSLHVFPHCPSVYRSLPILNRRSEGTKTEGDNHAERLSPRV